MIWASISVLTVVVLAAEAAAAQTGARIYPSIGIASDYRYSGVSLSGREPVLQGNVHWQRTDGYYAGVFATGVDFDDPSDTSYEIDLYAGRKLSFAKTELTLEALHTAFPEQGSAGPSYDFSQFKTHVRGTLNGFSAGAMLSWIPEASYGSGTAWRVAADARWTLSPLAVVSGGVGRRWIESGVDRTYWDLGITLAARHLALDIRYVDTNLPEGRCGFGPDACDATIVFVLTWKLPALPLD